MPPTMFCRALLLFCKLAASPMVTPVARPIHGFANVPVIAEAEPVVNAHAPGSCSTGRGDDGRSAPMAALARARMRSTAVTLFMKDGSPCWHLPFLPVLTSWEDKDARVRSACLLSCLSLKVLDAGMSIGQSRCQHIPGANRQRARAMLCPPATGECYYREDLAHSRPRRNGFVVNLSLVTTLL